MTTIVPRGLLALIIAASGVAAAPTEVRAEPPTQVQFAHTHYDVYFGTCPHDMRSYGSYSCLHDAEDAAAYLRSRGYVAGIYSH